MLPRAAGVLQRLVLFTRRRSLPVLALACVATGGAAGVAVADTLVYYEGTISGLTTFVAQASVRKLSGIDGSCFNVAQGGSWVGAQSCAYTDNSVASHDYCSCALRYPVAFNSNGRSTTGRWREDFS